ncbi:beta-galactosidase trimerization domain-containing protein [Nocardiopsis sp. CNT-189]|uniref:beta-galactosidase trimerization domain-containing protein n=1 Tax=Nocardiopsis oceanisediminis TaxID=2816862 RepID=UPI003B2DDFB9
MDTGSLWIDERLRELPQRPWRQVMIDFNNSPGVQGVGAAFDPGEFASTLKDAHVEAVTVVAKDVNGYCYFPSGLGPHLPEPGSGDLLVRQVEACKAAGIRVQAIYPVWADEYLAERHPEWLLMRRDRTTGAPPVGETPTMTQMCISHPGVLDTALQHTAEILEGCDVDGMWFDMINPAPFSVAECYCLRCVTELRDAGEDPLDMDAQRRRQNDLFTEAVRRLSEHTRSLRPGIQVEYNTIAVLGSQDRIPHLDNIEIECQPTGLWGYDYLPVHGRYARTLGVPVYGMTGKFNTHWGDYGGLKHPVQLRTELAGTVANGLHCDIGDDPGPGLRLDPATYSTIGEAYAEVARLEPYLEQAVPVAEAAIVVDGPLLSQFFAGGDSDNGAGLEEALQRPQETLEAYMAAHMLGTSVSGVARLLMEHGVQFDVADLSADLERYRLLVLPESVEVDAALAGRLNGFAESGGAVIASHHAAHLAGSDRLWPAALGGTHHGPAPFERPYTRVAGELLGQAERYAEFDFALYEGAEQWRIAGDGARVHAHLTEPVSDAMHLKDYAVPASGVPSEYAAVAEAGGVGVFSFPVGTSYFNHGYWVYRELFGQMLGRLLPEPVLRTTAPRSAEVTLTHQTRAGNRPERWIAHVVNYSPMRAPLGRIARLEEPIPLNGVEVALAVDTPISGAFEARTGTRLPVHRDRGRWRVTVPRIEVAATVAFEAAADR